MGAKASMEAGRSDRRVVCRAAGRWRTKSPLVLDSPDRRQSARSRRPLARKQRPQYALQRPLGRLERGDEEFVKQIRALAPVSACGTPVPLPAGPVIRQYHQINPTDPAKLPDKNGQERTARTMQPVAQHPVSVPMRVKEPHIRHTVRQYVGSEVLNSFLTAARYEAPP